MAIENGFERYIPDVLSGGFNIINQAQMEEIAKIFGKSFLMEPNAAQKERSKAYIHSETKMALDIAFGRLALAFGGQYLIEKTFDRIGRRNGTNEYYWLNVGFLGQPSMPIPKIPTMRAGAHEEIQNPFLSTSFIGGRGSMRDERILSEVAGEVRRESKDELPQLISLRDGSMTIVGCRAYTSIENRGTFILERLAETQAVQFDDVTKWILGLYRDTVADFQPIPAVASPTSAYLSKDTAHLIRLWLDLAYLWHASPALDLKILVLTIINRGLKKKGAR